MINALSIRDIVLIERLDIALENGLTVLTGETGAGKSILLDALGLALGGRGDAGLVRHGAAKGTVTAAFNPPLGHGAFALLEDQGISTDREIVLRRIQGRDGLSRAFINDQPVSIALLRQVGGMLAEIHGQHDNRALFDVSHHRQLLDAFGDLGAAVDRVAQSFEALAAAQAAVEQHRGMVERGEAERAFIEHALAELQSIAPVVGEEEKLSLRRQLMMNAEQFADAMSDARRALDAEGSLSGRLNAALRKLERRRQAAAGQLDELIAALERVAAEVADATRILDAAERSVAFDQAELERAEERLFALRSLARKHKVAVDDLPALLARFEAEKQALADDGRILGELERTLAGSRAAYDAAARELSLARNAAARRLDRAVAGEFAPLRLERARFVTRVETDPGKPAAHGTDRVEFLVAVNPGTPLSPLTKVASGGELSRFMLALKVALSAKASAPTLIFDEIDTGVGGAVADAIGQRLARLASGLQVLAVTHSPQVASRAASHFLITKIAAAGETSEDDQPLRVVTRLDHLQGPHRREEIARMLSGAEITDEARAQAARLLAAE
jgi:DNA repair protein RecN (Recombination protein N)